MAKSVAARVRQRIAESDHELTVHYPAWKETPTGASPLAAAPVSPLIKAPAPVLPNTLYVDPVRPPITMPCLLTVMTFMSQARQEKFQHALGLWVLGTEALARVDKDAALRDDGETVFVGCDHVEIDGRKYQVLNVAEIASSVSTDGGYYVLLKGMARN